MQKEISLFEGSRSRVYISKVDFLSLKEQGQGQHAYAKVIFLLEGSTSRVNMHIKRRFPYWKVVGLGFTYQKEISFFQGSRVRVNMHIKRRLPYLKGVGLGSTCISKGDPLITREQVQGQHAYLKEISLFRENMVRVKMQVKRTFPYLNGEG